MDLCFIIDISASLRDNNPPNGSRDNWGLQLEFLSQVTDIFTIGPTDTKVGAVVLSEQADMAFSMDSHPTAESVKNAIRTLLYNGSSTNTAQGLKVTREQCFSPANGERPGVLNLAILITDGQPDPANRKEQALREAESLKGIATVITIGVTNVTDTELLREISSTPQLESQTWFVVEDFSELKVIRAVIKATCETVQGTR